MKINKQVTIGCLVLGLLVLFYFFNPLAEFSGHMRGSIIKVKGNSIVVEGVVESSDSKGSNHEDRTVEFEINQSTVLTSRTIVITQENIESGQSFQPKTEDRPGVFSDLTEGVGIIRIESKDNLFKTDKATALEIIYTSYDFPEK